jgi:hypothetical protein
MRFAPYAAALRAGGILTVASVVSLSTALAQVPAPTHIYELNGSYADTLGGPAMAPQGGTLGPTGYNFGLGQGPSLGNAASVINSSVYSLEMYFEIDQVSSYRSLISFDNRTTDSGLYNNNANLTLYRGGNVAVSPTPVFAPNVMTHLLVTRDGSNNFTAYVNGVQQFTYADTQGVTTFSGPNNIIWLLRDNSGENASGFLDFVRIYDTPLTQAQIAERYQTVVPGGATAAPEPGTLALLGMGMLVGGVVARRKRH